MIYLFERCFHRKNTNFSIPVVAKGFLTWIISKAEMYQVLA